MSTINKDIPVQVVNQQFFQKVAAGDTEKLGEALTDYTRLTLREEGLLRKIMPPQTITSAELDKQVDTDKPVKIVDKEVQQPLSIGVPFGTLPKNHYMRGKRYRVDFARLLTREFSKDVRELEQYDYDIRETFKDNAIKDHMTLEDIPFFNSVDSIVGSTGNVASPTTGKVQYYDFSTTANPLGVATGFTRASVTEALKILPKGYGTASIATPIRLQTETVVMNVNTGAEFVKMGRDVIGGDLSETMFKNGLTESTFFGKKFIFTLKDDVVQDGKMYMFAGPQFLGKFYELEAPTMFVEKRAFMLRFFLYSSIGAAIGNPYGVAVAKFF